MEPVGLFKNLDFGLIYKLVSSAKIFICPCNYILINFSSVHASLISKQKCIIHNLKSKDAFSHKIE